MPPSRERLFQRLTQRNPELAENGKIRFKAAEPDLDHLHDPHYVFTNPDMRGSKLTDYDAIFTNDDLEVTTYAVHARILTERAQRQGA
jgi:guanylate kinase